eukprot:COSAG05_NODE_1276_length_5305_cov_7.675759_7_plen_39_part_00
MLAERAVGGMGKVREAAAADVNALQAVEAEAPAAVRHL